MDTEKRAAQDASRQRALNVIGALVLFGVILMQVESLMEYSQTKAPSVWRIVMRSLGIIGFCLVEYGYFQVLRRTKSAKSRIAKKYPTL